jgi:surface antigen
MKRKPSVYPDVKCDLNLTASLGNVMKQVASVILSAATLAIAVPVLTTPAAAHHTNARQNKVANWPRNLQCVPYARHMSGIEIYGNAHTWWGKAAGKYQRGSWPQEGAVMSMKPHRGSRLGHVAYVSRVVDSRNILISHANWSRINGRRGQIENNVPVMDVSPNNDWSKVRIWYHSLQALGGTHWPLNGFIYGPGRGQAAAPAAATRAPKPAQSQTKPQSKLPSRAFREAFADLDKPAKKPRTARRYIARR